MATRSQYEIFQRMLIDARKAAGLTQEALAERLGVNQSYVSRVESGERRLDVLEYLDVAAALGLDAVGFIDQLRRAIAARTTRN